MNLEDLKIDDVVEAKCLGCTEAHVWQVKTLHMSPRVAIQRDYDRNGCTCARQVVYAEDIDRKIGGRL
jgi:hypothetical protein